VSTMTTRTLIADEVWRWDRTADLRATDYPEDTQQWVWLLTKVYDRPDAGDEFLGALNYVRCQGARIIPTAQGDGWRLGRGECPGDEYDRIRAAVFSRDAKILQALFRSMPGRHVD
jgi:hypothetical protein